MKSLQSFLLVGLLALSSFSIMANVAVSVHHQVIYDECNGTLEFLAVGDNGPFMIDVFSNYGTESFGLSNGESYQLNNLPVGTYTINVTDDAGCVREQVVYVDCSCIMQIQNSIITQPENCASSDGSISLNITGTIISAEKLLYSWSNGAITQILSGLSAGTYSVTVTDENGCEAEASFTLEGPVNIEPFQASVTPTCEGTSDGSVSVFFEGSLENWNISSDYSDYSFNEGGNYTVYQITEAPAGMYCITLTHASVPDCEFSECYQIEEEPSEGAFEISSMDIVHDASCCSDVGSINIAVSGGNPLPSENYEYQWSNGSTMQDLINVTSGTYTVTVTDYCGREIVHSFTVQDQCVELELAITSDCLLEEFTLDDVSITGGTPPYSFETLTWNDGHQSLYVVDANGCFAEVLPEEWEYSEEAEIEVFVEWWFEGHLGDAQIIFSSDDFEQGGLMHIEETNQTVAIPPSYILPVPVEFKDVDVFHYTYTSPSGCITNGTFSIPTCNQEDSFGFTVELITEKSECIGGQSHTHQINVHNMGPQPPYFIEVTMEEAAASQESDFKKVVEVTNQNFLIGGIPAGRVKFRAFNKCFYDLYTQHDRNCCPDFHCELESITETSQWDESLSYNFTFFSLVAAQTCYDDSGTFGLDQVSEVIIQPDFSAHPSNCWTGQISIYYPTGEVEILEVDENNDINWISQLPERWQPPQAGNYEFVIEYGSICQITEEISWYGDGNYLEVVGLYDDLWFEEEDPWDNAYYGAFMCQVCEAVEEPYLIGNTECHDNTDNFDYVFFDFVPDSYGSDPCNSGGELTIIDYVNGIPAIKTVIIPDDVSLDSKWAEQLGADPSLICWNSGWCLFDAIHAYGVSFDKPLLVTWGDPESCEPWETPDENSPGNNCTSNGDCPGGLICHEGNCYFPCEDNDDCPNGDCVDGICVPSNECEPGCSGNAVCINGECLEMACDFSAFRNHGHNGFYKELYVGDWPPQSILQISGSIRLDQKFILGGAVQPEYTYCASSTDTPGEWERTHIIEDPSLPITVSFPDATCADGLNMGFNVTFSCLHPNSSGEYQIPTFESTLMSDDRQVVIYPNPFDNEFWVQLHSGEERSVEYRIYNLIGELIEYKELDVIRGLNEFPIQTLNNFPDGVYLIQFRDHSGWKLDKRMLKMN